MSRAATRTGAVAALACACIGALTPSASAHSPTDFLKVSVGSRSTVLLPPMHVASGRVEVTLAATQAFRISAVSAGPGWRERVTPDLAVLDGHQAAGRPLLVTVTGTAHHAGAVPLVVRAISPSAPTQVYRWTLTALAGYARPTTAVTPSRPNAAVDLPPDPSPRLWPVSIALAVAALAVLALRRRPRPNVTA